jgi:hypothetical protein
MRVAGADRETRSITLLFVASRRSTSARMEVGTPQLSTVTSTAGPSSSLPIASALAKMCCETPVFGKLARHSR